MQFPFNTKGRYLSNTETKKLAEYLAVEPLPDTVYTNSKGEQRRVQYTLRPLGCIASDTAFEPGQCEDGSRNYHTPGAVIDGAEAQIHYTDVKTGEGKVTTSNEWVKWCGNMTTMEPYVVTQKAGTVDAYVETLKKVSGKPPRKMTDEDRDAKWISLKDGTPRS